MLPAALASAPMDVQGTHTLVRAQLCVDPAGAGTARVSPWGDLANFVAFQLNDYNFEINRHLWIHNYELISRANLAIANVPNIQMDAGERDRLVGEAKFLRALAYFNLVTLFDNVACQHRLLTKHLGVRRILRP